MSICVTTDSVVHANEQFWQPMLNMELIHHVEILRHGFTDRHLAGSCELSGVWTGRIEVRLTLPLARKATATMLMQDENLLEEADMVDAVKEIANMIAGTIKSALPRPCAMSLPQAAMEHILPAEETHQTAENLCVCFMHPTGELLVRVSQLPAEESNTAICESGWMPMRSALA